MTMSPEACAQSQAETHLEKLRKLRRDAMLPTKQQK